MVISLDSRTIYKLELANRTCKSTAEFVAEALEKIAEKLPYPCEGIHSSKASAEHHYCSECVDDIRDEAVNELGCDDCSGYSEAHLCKSCLKDRIEEDGNHHRLIRSLIAEIRRLRT